MNDTEDFRKIPCDLMVEFFPDQHQHLQFECENTKCFYATTDRQKLFNHQQSCRSKTLIKCKQVVYAQPDRSIRQLLEQEGIIPDSTWHNWHFCTFDIECFLEEIIDEMNQPKKVYRLVSIALKSSFGDEEESNIYIERENMDPFELKTMMQKLLSSLTFLREDMLNYIPESVIKGQKEYQKLVSDKEFKKLPVEEQRIGREKLRYLNDCLKLRIYSWNGERYDNNVVWAPFMDMLQYNSDAFSKIHIIRRGTGIMEFTYGTFCFRDFLNFSTPMTLEKFAASQFSNDKTKEIQKTTFPYELYSDISELKTIREFPGYPHFISSLCVGDKKYKNELIKICNSQFEAENWKSEEDIQSFFQFSRELKFIFGNGRLIDVVTTDDSDITSVLHTCPVKYFKSKEIFDNRCENMSDYLRLYNLNDVILLADCIKIYAEGYFNSWNVNIHQKMSLPGVSQGKIIQFSKFYISRK